METKIIKKSKSFDPIMFLMSLGAGGLSIGLWAFFMFTFKHGKGLFNHDQLSQVITSNFQKYLFFSTEVLIIIMAIVHLVTITYLLIKYFKWLKTKDYKNYISDPLRNNGIMTVFLTITMTFNVIFAIGNHFIFKNGPLFQPIMGPALIGYFILYIFTMGTSIKILKIAFTNTFDFNKIHFGFMMHPFALSMLAVTGFGISAFSKNYIISSIAFFLAFAPWLVAILLTLIKIVTMFQHHFKNNLPDRNFLPSTLIVMPTIMLIFLSLTRIGHYLHNNLKGVEIGPAYYAIVTIIPFVFLFWYGLFSLTLIKDYFKTYKKFNVTQWGFICPIAAFNVIGFAMNKYWLGGVLPFGYILLTFVFFGIIVYFDLFFKQVKSI